MNKRHYEHTLPNIRGSLSNTYSMVLMTTKEIPYRLNPIGMVSSFARRQVASPFFTDCSVPTFLISLFPFYSSVTACFSFTALM